MKNVKKQAFLKLLTFVATIVLILFCGCKNFFSSQKKDDNTLIVGMMSGWPPYMSINKQGAYEGFDVDVAKALAKQLGKKLIIKDLGGLTPLFLSLQQNKIDAIFSGLDITKKRQETLDMVQYTGEGIKAFYLLFWEKIPQGINSIDDLKNIKENTICVEPSSPSETFLSQPEFEKIKKKSISKTIDMIMEIKYGKSLCAILEPMIVQDLQNKNPEIKTLKVPLPEEFQIFGAGIALKKNSQLTTQVAQAITTLKENGTMKKLETKWNIMEVQK